MERRSTPHAYDDRGRMAGSSNSTDDVFNKFAALGRRVGRAAIDETLSDTFFLTLWIIRVGDYDSDWRRGKKLCEAALATGDFLAYYQEMGKANSCETDPKDRNFFANCVLVHDK